MRRRQQTLQGDPGTDRIPFDRTDPMVDVPAPQPGGGGSSFEGQPGGGPQDQGLDLLSSMGQNAAPPGGGLGGLAGPDPSQGLGGGNTDQLTGADLGSMGGDAMDPDAAQVDQMLQMLQDPNTPPDQKQMIQAQIAMAAKRRLAGGAGGLGGGLGA